MLVNYGISHWGVESNAHLPVPLVNEPFANKIPRLVQTLAAQTSVLFNIPDEINFYWPNNPPIYRNICLLIVGISTVPFPNGSFKLPTLDQISVLLGKGLGISPRRQICVQHDCVLYLNLYL